MTTPIDRLRELHRPCPRPNCNSLYSHCDLCGQGAMGWPCDTIAALDALEAEAEWLRAQAAKALDAQRAEIDALQARLDAATVLAEAVQWLIDEARGSREWRATRGMKPATDISRFKACSLSALIVIERELGRALSAWLAGDKEAGNE